MAFPYVDCDLQMLVNVLFLHKEKNDSVPLRRLHTQREPYEHHDCKCDTLFGV